MANTMSRVEIWSGVMPNQPGGLAEILAPFAKAGANLTFVLARRQSHNPAAGVVYVAADNAALRKAAKAGGMAKATNLHALRVEGPDKAGIGASMTGKLAAAGINLRGLSSISMGKKFVLYLAFDTAADLSKAVKALK